MKFEQTAAGDVEIGTGSGDVEIKGAKGAVKVQTGSGSITAQGDPTGDWRLHTGSGDVSVELPQKAAFNLVARTSSGSIDTSREIAVQGKLNSARAARKSGRRRPDGGTQHQLRQHSDPLEFFVREVQTRAAAIGFPSPKISRLARLSHAP